MKQAFLSILLVMLPGLMHCQPKQNAQSQPFVLTHATILDATGAPAKLDMTVIIRGDRIDRIGPAKTVHTPQDATVIDASGKFLIPGLWDMHIHWYFKDHLPLFIANGVTGVRQMWGMPMHYNWREQIENGTLLGPRMVIASPIIDGPKPIWPQSIAVSNDSDAREAVLRVIQDGADFVKVYSLLPREAYFAIADESKKHRRPFSGHVPLLVSAEEASDAGQKSIEHLDGILVACSTRKNELRNRYEDILSNLPEDQRIPPPVQTRPLTRLMLESFSQEKADALFARYKKNHTWQCPTLTVLRSTAFIDDPNFVNDSRLKYMPTQIRISWDPATDSRFKQRTAEDFELQRLVYKKHIEFISMMKHAGVEFLAGTDTLNPYCFPGFSLHDELDLLVQAGLTPMEALQTATLNPARFLGKEKDLGTIEEGKLADLVLLDENPLLDINNTRKIFSVVVGGKLIPKSELQAMLAKVETIASEN